MQINDFTVLDPLIGTSGGGGGLNHNLYAVIDPTIGDKAPVYTNGSRWINTVTDTHWVLVDEVNGIWKETTQISSTADLEAISVPFQWNTASPLTLFSVKNGDIICNCEITIVTAFDDNGATLLVGSSALPALIMPAKMSRPSKVAVYGNEQNFIFVGNETIRLTINPGASTQGSGYVLCQVKRS